MNGDDRLDIAKIKKLLNPYLEKNNLRLYDIELVKEFGYLILRVLVDKAGGIDIDELASCNEFLSAELDSMDQDMPEYMLEVSSPGAEKKLNCLDEVLENIGAYVHVELPNMIYEGHIISVEGEEISIRYNAKGRFKTIKIPYQEIKLIRLAVKI